MISIDEPRSKEDYERMNKNFKTVHDLKDSDAILLKIYDCPYNKREVLEELARTFKGTIEVREFKGVIEVKK